MQTSVINAKYPHRKEGLEVHTVSDQVVIYESGSDTVHYLNPPAAVVLELCDGTRSATDIVALVQEAYGLATPPVREVNECLTDLKASGLIC